jgi:hypothetical protein
MTPALPLFNWQKQAEHVRLQNDRDQLLLRIAKLPPRAHRRVALEDRVRQATLKLMSIENELYGDRL